MPKKIVRFSSKIKLHNVCMCDEHKLARKGHWHMYACDRAHFKRLIDTKYAFLNDVLLRMIEKIKL